MTYGTINVDTVTTSTQGGILGAGNASAMKNRIINGAMVIDQRNAGASVASGSYPVDRWLSYGSQSAKFTAQQNAGSVTPPVGFTNYLGTTSSSAYSINSTDQFLVTQKIEGYNIADLGWGTANAKTVTLSFQVYSSLTGTFGGSLQNASANRCYPFSYSIPVANTWASISVTVAGDTTGTWLTTNGIGINVNFSLGTGSSYSATAGAWTATSFVTSATGATSVVGTSGATFYITGVQLEVGSSATGFEYRQYGTELALCQRYAYVWSTTATQVAIASGFQYNSGSAYYTINFPVQMRSSPTLNSVTASNWNNLYSGGQGTTSAVSINASNPNSASILTTQTSSAGYSNILWSGTTSANMQFVSEL